MEKIYYSPKGYWKGYDAIEKLAKAAKVSGEKAREWLQKQPIWQIYLPRPRYIPQARFDIDIPNEAHQADLLFLPHDNGYKYALTVIDVASRFKEAEPLKSKRSEAVARAFEKIYRRTLTWPKTLMVDPGREFMGRIAKFMEERGTKIRYGKVNIHKNQALVERFNKTLSEDLFAYQYSKVLDGNRNREWVERLPRVIQALNNRVTRLTGQTPSKAIKLSHVECSPSTVYHRPVGDDELIILIGTSVRRLYETGDMEGDGNQRATDPIWSLRVHEIESVLIKPKQPALYHLSDANRGYVREELMIVFSV